MAQRPLDVLDAKPVQVPKVDDVPQSYDPVLSDDWQRELRVIPCSQQFKNNILQVNGQEASIHQVLFYSSNVTGE